MFEDRGRVVRGELSGYPKILIFLHFLAGAFSCLESVTSNQLSTEESRCFHSSGKTPIIIVLQHYYGPPTPPSTEGFPEKRNHERKCVVLPEKLHENARMEVDTLPPPLFMSWILFKFGWTKITKSTPVNADVELNYQKLFHLHQIT